MGITSWAGPHGEEGAERLLYGAASRWSQPQGGVVTRDSSRATATSSIDTAPSGQEDTAVGRVVLREECKEERPGFWSRAWSLRTYDVTKFQEEGFMHRVRAERHSSVRSDAFRASGGRWGIRANPG